MEKEERDERRRKERELGDRRGKTLEIPKISAESPQNLFFELKAWRQGLSDLQIKESSGAIRWRLFRSSLDGRAKLLGREYWSDPAIEALMDTDDDDVAADLLQKLQKHVREGVGLTPDIERSLARGRVVAGSEGDRTRHR